MEEHPKVVHRLGWLLQPGQTLVGTYQIKDLVGRPSGMGQVFAATDSKLNRQVALKVPALEVIASQQGSERFLREAKLAASLDHKNIVKIYTCQSDPAVSVSIGSHSELIPVPFIVMEYLGGGSLAERLKPEGLPLDQVSDMADALCDAVHHAHQHSIELSPTKKKHRIIHRDLKPENICFDQNGRLVVVDFGLARWQEDSATTGGIVGTFPYMAPEQWSPSLGIDHRTDIYALGVILFQMCTGHRPFIEDGPEKYMAAHMSQRPPDPRMIRTDTPSRVADAILRSMAKRKEDRFESAEQLRLALREGFRGNREIRAMRHRQTADEFARHDKFREAIAEYDQAIMLNPTEVNALVNRGYSWHKLGMNQEAVADLTYAIRFDPLQPEAFNTRGMALKEQGHFAVAIADFEQALRLDPEHPLAPANIRDARRRLERPSPTDFDNPNSPKDDLD